MQKYHLSLVTFGLGMHFHSSQTGMFPLQRWRTGATQECLASAQFEEETSNPLLVGPLWAPGGSLSSHGLVLIPTFSTMF